MTAPVRAAQRALVRAKSRLASYRWNEQAARYIAPNGRFVSADEIRRQLDRSLRNSEARIVELAQELRGGTVSLNTWHQEMRVIIKDVHLYSGALARGGWAQLTPRDLSQISQLVRVEYDYLYGFALKLSTGSMPLNGRVAVFAELYGEAGRHTYELIRQQMMIEAGYTHERNVLHPADHCAECIAMTARKRVPIGTLIPIGDRICGRRCRCSIEYSS